MNMNLNDVNALVKYFNFKREPTSGSRCIDMGRIHSAPNTQYPPYPDKLPYVYQEVVVGRRLDELHLVYIDSGSGWYTNDQGDRFRITPGTVLLLYPNVYHSYKPDSEVGWSEYWVGCNGSYPNWLVKEDAFKDKKNSVFKPGRYDGLRDDFLQLCHLSLSKHSPAIKSQLLGGLINRLLGRMLVIQNTCPVFEDDGLTKVVEKITSYLDANIETDIDMSELPVIAGMRYDRLSPLFQQATGMTPHQYYLDKKIHKAISLLRSGLSVKETSYRLCFDSPYYFSRIFKKKTGESPATFKNRL